MESPDTGVSLAPPRQPVTDGQPARFEANEPPAARPPLSAPEPGRVQDSGPLDAGAGLQQYAEPIPGAGEGWADGPVQGSMQPGGRPQHAAASWPAGSDDTQGWTAFDDRDAGTAQRRDESEQETSASVVPDSWFAGPSLPDPRQDDTPDRWTAPPEPGGADTGANGWTAQQPGHSGFDGAVPEWQPQTYQEGFHQPAPYPPQGNHAPEPFPPQPYQEQRFPVQARPQPYQEQPYQEQPYQEQPYPAQSYGWDAAPGAYQAPHANETAVLGPAGGPQPMSGFPPGMEPAPGMGAGFDQGSPGYPGGPTGYPPAEHRPMHGSGRSGGRAPRPLMIGVGVLVMVALVAVATVVWPDGGKDTSSAGASSSNAPVKATTKAKRSGPARQQAVAIDGLLNASGASRGELGQALRLTKKCKDIPAAMAGMQKVEQQRRQQVDRAQALQVGALANGTRLRATLTRSLQYSLQVDQAYLAWARHALGCKRKPRPDENYRRGAKLSNQASVSKNQFAALWAPVAREQGLRARTATQF